MSRNFVVKTQAGNDITKFRVILHTELVEQDNAFNYYAIDVDDYITKMTTCLENKYKTDQGTLNIHWLLLSASEPTTFANFLPQIMAHVMKHKTDIVLVDDMEYTRLYGEFDLFDDK